jgi:hypothetical protein
MLVQLSIKLSAMHSLNHGIASVLKGGSDSVRLRGMLTIRVFWILCLISLVLPVISFGHGSGLSFETEKEGYFIDIGVSSEPVLSLQSTRFDLSLFDASSNEAVDFTDVWVRIEEGRKVLFAGGVHVPNLGPTGFSYAFPNAGLYQVSVRYQEDGSALTEYSFELPVIEGQAAVGNNTAVPKKLMLIASYLAAFLIGGGVVYIILWRRKQTWKTTKETATE